MKHEEKELEQKCCTYARKKGLAAVRLEKNGNKGIPDVAFIKHGGKTLFVEFKTPSGVVSPEQHYWKRFLGYSCEIIRDFDSFCVLLDIYFAGV